MPSALLALLLAIAAAPAWGHPITAITVRVAVGDGVLRVELRGTGEDLVLLHDLVGDGAGVDPAALARALAAHRALIADGVRFTAGDRVLEPGAVAIREAPGADAPWADLLRAPVIAAFTVPFAGDPADLAVLLDLGGAARGVAVSFVVVAAVGGAERPALLMREGVAYPLLVDDAASLPGMGPDGGPPHLVDPHAAETAGLSWLYVARDAVRHEILLPLSLFAARIERAAPAVLDPAEQRAAAEAIGRYLRERNPVTIDGATVAPVVADVRFHPVGADDPDAAVARERLPLPMTRVGVVLRYPLSADPRRVVLEWNAFPASLERIDCTLIAHGERTHHRLTRREPRVAWSGSGPPPPALAAPPAAGGSPRELPVATLALAAAALLAALVLRGRPRWLATVMLGVLALACWPVARVRLAAPAPPADPAAVCAALVENVYRAFAHRDQGRIYDALALSVAGGQLAELYLDLRRHLAVQRARGAAARVADVELLAFEPLAPSSDAPLRARCTWEVVAELDHWGHRHRRRDRYRAALAIAPRDGAWKIVEVALEEKERLE